MNSIIKVNPTLYLDIDGVILPSQPDISPFETVFINRLEQFAPEVVRRIGETCLDLVWCSTRNNEEIQRLSEQMNALKNGRYLHVPYAVPSSSRTTQKLNAIVADQQTSPSSFIWVDDQISVRHKSKIDLILVDRPHLIISPDTNTGLNDEELQSIEDFSQTHSPTVT